MLAEFKNKRYDYGMPIRPNLIQRVAVSRPAEALSAVRKIVLVLHGDRLSIPAVKTTDLSLVAGCCAGGRKTRRFSRNTCTPHVSRRISMGMTSCAIRRVRCCKCLGAAASAFVSRYRSSRKAREDQENRARRREAKEA